MKESSSKKWIIFAVIAIIVVLIVIIMFINNKKDKTNTDNNVGYNSSQNEQRTVNENENGEPDVIDDGNMIDVTNRVQNEEE